MEKTTKNDKKISINKLDIQMYFFRKCKRIYFFLCRIGIFHRTIAELF